MPSLNDPTPGGQKQEVGLRESRWQRVIHAVAEKRDGTSTQHPSCTQEYICSDIACRYWVKICLYFWLCSHFPLRIQSKTEDVTLSLSPPLILPTLLKCKVSCWSCESMPQHTSGRSALGQHFWICIHVVLQGRYPSLSPCFHRSASLFPSLCLHVNAVDFLLSVVAGYGLSILVHTPAVASSAPFGWTALRREWVRQEEKCITIWYLDGYMQNRQHAPNGRDSGINTHFSSHRT